jgi:gamma-glutamyl-gamma-aminobutyrate hydrolase PuuD
LASPRAGRFEDYRQAILHVAASRGFSIRRCRSTRRWADIDGLLLTGGDDVRPSLYAEPAHPATVEATEAGRDDFEIGLDQGGRARELPILRHLPRRDRC